jgi:hypothetical protein
MNKQTASTSAGRVYVLPRPTQFSTTSGVTTIRAAVPFSKRRSRELIAGIEKAVYSHIRAKRALGRSTINTTEIAAALGIPVHQVNVAIRNLTSKGVRIAE